jgi:uracil-DNA glycosylase family 4
MGSNQQQSRALKAQLKNLIDIGITELPRQKKTSSPASPEPSDSTDHTAALKVIRDDVGDCQRCKLCSGRTNIVFGAGDPNAQLMFVGEAPGRDEDLKGEPFVGRSGQLLTKMIEAMGLSRGQVYIANIVKCRPPDNRYPELDEVETCQPFLIRQIETIRPKIIVSLGNLATQTLLQTKTGITALHGTFRDFHGAMLMPTYHPAFLLRNPNMKKPCWEDLQKVMDVLGLKKKAAAPS